MAGEEVGTQGVATGAESIESEREYRATGGNAEQHTRHPTTTLGSSLLGHASDIGYGQGREEVDVDLTIDLYNEPGRERHRGYFGTAIFTD
jgi:hypothetical protein